jgi:hypothetical protein
VLAGWIGDIASARSIANIDTIMSAAAPNARDDRGKRSELFIIDVVLLDSIATIPRTGVFNARASSSVNFFAGWCS